MLVCYAGDYTAVIKVYDGAVVPDLSILQEQIRKIRTSFLIRLVRMEVLFELILEHFMGLPGLCPISTNFCIFINFMLY